MRSHCRSCGSAVNVGRFCSACGTEQQPPDVPAVADALIGQMLLGRYEIVERISEGGMGLVYRALHRPLERSVAVKLIHPSLAADKDIVARFMVEAQVASRLNHPNIVSIHDFGWTPPSEGGHLILVMELLTGPSLTSLLKKKSAPLAPERAADIAVQILSALSEAHFHGVVHRDVKPANVLLQPERGGRDRVKLIDFGIARFDSGRRITRQGQILGTTTYMAPEQTSGRDVGPSADLYAVGVILFQMLAGRVPFVGPTPEIVMAQHAQAPRPDPRAIAPNRDISNDLASICMRAMAIDQRSRFPNAEAFVEALTKAVNLPGVERVSRSFGAFERVSPLPPERGSSRPPADAPTRFDRPSSRPSPIDEVTVAQQLFTASPPPFVPPPRGLVGRADELAWALEMLNGQCPTSGFVLWGAAGVGRTSLLRALLGTAATSGARVVSVSAKPTPMNEVSGSGLGLLIAELTSVPPWHHDLVSGTAAKGHLESLGLRAIFGNEGDLGTVHPETFRAAFAAALTWAIHGAKKAARRALLVVAIDDVDEMDSPSRAAIATLLSQDPIARVALVVTSERSPEIWAKPPLFGREILPLSRRDALASFDDPKLSAALDSSLQLVEPLYVEQLAHWLVEVGEETAPRRIMPLIEARLLALPAGPRWLLQAVTVLGEATIDAVAELVPDPERFDESLLLLALAGLIRIDGEFVRPGHALFGHLARAMAPRGAMELLHERALQAALRSNAPFELVTYHRAYCPASDEAYAAFEERAWLRSTYGDEEGAIASYWDGLRLARAAFMNGEEEAEDVWLGFVEKLARSLTKLGRLDEAAGVFNDILELLKPSDPRRFRVLEALARTAAARGRVAEAHARLRDAIEAADAAGEETAASRLRYELSGSPHVEVPPPPPISRRKPPSSR